MNTIVIKKLLTLELNQEVAQPQLDTMLVAILNGSHSMQFSPKDKINCSMTVKDITTIGGKNDN